MEFELFRRLLSLRPVSSGEVTVNVDYEGYVVVSRDGNTIDRVKSLESIDVHGGADITKAFKYVQDCPVEIAAAVLALIAGNSVPDRTLFKLEQVQDKWGAVMFEADNVSYRWDIETNELYTLWAANDAGLENTLKWLHEDFDMWRAVTTFTAFPYLCKDMPLGFDSYIKTEDRLLCKEGADREWDEYEVSVYGAIRLALEHKDLYCLATTQVTLFTLHEGIQKQLDRLQQSIAKLMAQEQTESYVRTVEKDMTQFYMQNGSKVITFITTPTYLIGYNCPDGETVGVLARAAEKVISRKCAPDAEVDINSYMERLGIKNQADEIIRILRLCDKEDAIDAILSFIEDVK